MSQDSLASHATNVKSTETTAKKDNKRQSKKRNFAQFAKTANASPSVQSVASSRAPSKRVRHDEDKKRDLLN